MLAMEQFPSSHGSLDDGERFGSPAAEIRHGDRAQPSGGEDDGFDPEEFRAFLRDRESRRRGPGGDRGGRAGRAAREAADSDEDAARPRACLDSRPSGMGWSPVFKIG